MYRVYFLIAYQVPYIYHPRRNTGWPFFTFRRCLLAYSQLVFRVLSCEPYTYYNAFSFDTNRIPGYRSVSGEHLDHTVGLAFNQPLVK